MIYSINESTGLGDYNGFDFGPSTIIEAGIIGSNMLNEAFNDLKFSILLGENRMLMKYGGDLNALREADDDDTDTADNIFEAIKNILIKFRDMCVSLIEKAINFVKDFVKNAIFQFNAMKAKISAEVAGKFIGDKEKKLVLKYSSGKGGSSDNYLKYIRLVKTPIVKKDLISMMFDGERGGKLTGFALATDMISSDDIENFTGSKEYLKKSPRDYIKQLTYSRQEAHTLPTIPHGYEIKDVIGIINGDGKEKIDDILNARKKVEKMINDNIKEAKKAMNSDNASEKRKFIENCRIFSRYNLTLLSVSLELVKYQIQAAFQIFHAMYKDAKKNNDKEEGSTTESFDMLLGSISRR